MAKFGYILDSGVVKLSENPEDDFIFLTEQQLIKLRDIIKKDKKNYNDLSKDDLSEIIYKNREYLPAL
jgi:hypothetical protein